MSQQMEESTTVVISQTAETGTAEKTLMELRCAVQSLETDLDSMRTLKVSLENSLREVEMHYATRMEQLNGIRLHLESELSQTGKRGRTRSRSMRPC